MATFVTDCPRCPAVHSTFDILGQNQLGIRYDWMRVMEVFAVCRRCRGGSIFIAEQAELKDGSNAIWDAQGMRQYDGSVDRLIRIAKVVSVSDRAGRPLPEHTNGKLATAFEEAARCEAAGCWNASAAMYRATIDLLTKPLLPLDGEPNAFVRRNLGARLDWLFANGLLPHDLQDHAKAIQLDGNDGVHDVNLTKVDAADVGDFTELIIQRMVTMPQQLKEAAARRQKRRATGDAAD